MTLYLYQHNPLRSMERQTVVRLDDIPWVAQEWSVHPRSPLPLSFQWTEDQAATKLQAYFRGYLVSIYWPSPIWSNTNFEFDGCDSKYPRSTSLRESEKIELIKGDF